MRKLTQLAKVFALGAALTAGTASANISDKISFGGVPALDNSGLTSQFIDPNTPFAVSSLTGFFIETFDVNSPSSQTPGVLPPGGDQFNVPGVSDGCGITSTGVSVSILSPAVNNANTIGVRTGSETGVAAAPANDETCYGYVTNRNPDRSPIAPVTIIEFDYAGLLTQFADTGITYLGFYWGSVDDFNTFRFFSGANEVAELTGAELLAELGGVSGDQLADTSNVYVNLDFNFADRFDRLVIETRGVAGEFDNIVVGLSQRPPTPIPAPAGIAMFALGLVALGLRSRFKK